MPMLRVTDGVDLFYKDLGAGQPIVFCHGWPLNADAWDAQVLFFVNNGYRVVAHDRRSHGRSTQVSKNNTMDAYADDLAALMDELNVMDAVLVGHSTGGGEVVRYIARHSSKRVSKVVLMGAVPPVMLRSEKNPNGLPRDAFDVNRAGVAKNRSQFFLDLTMPFFGYSRQGATISEGVRQHFWLQGMLGGINGQFDCVEQFSETDFTEDLKRVDVPVLLMHGDDDQIVPIADASMLSVKLIPNATLKVYPGLPHGMPITHHESINKDLLEFIRA